MEFVQTRSILMSFGATPWWAYLLTLAIAVLFGVLQCYLLKRTIQKGKPAYWLLALKLGLWLIAMVGLALISLLLLVVFVAAASVSLLCGVAVLYHKEHKEGSENA